MPNFRQLLFHQFAVQGVAISIDSFMEKYQPKKENRFNFDGITYETSPARLQADGIEFEISSKIPQDELVDRDDLESYFSAIKAVIDGDNKLPQAIDMENIVQDVGGDDFKERDYVRLRYHYGFDEMDSHEAVQTEIARLQADPAARALPDIPNVNTLAGKVSLLCIEDFFRDEATRRMERLIEANQHVRATFQRQAEEAPALPRPTSTGATQVLSGLVDAVE